MRICIQPSPLSGKVRAIASKSDAHRLLIAAALADAPTKLLLRGGSRDIDATVRSLTALGAVITRAQGSLTVEPIRGTPASPVLACGESASTMRFLLPVAPALCSGVRFTAEGRLPKRPLSPLKERMEEHGVNFLALPDGVSLTGRLSGGSYELPGDVSSQFISGLLFALPLTKEGGQIRLTTRLQSAGYVDMTLETLERFKIRVERKDNVFRVEGGQAYRSPGEIAVEGDWSNAAFFLAAGAVGGDVTVTGLNQSSLQCDRAIYPILESMGADISWQNGALRVKKSALKGIEIDAGDCPDLVPILASLAAYAEGETRIYNAARLRIKESDRLEAMAKNLSSMGADITELPDQLVIRGGSPLHSTRLSSFHDHRIAMSLAVAASTVGGIIAHADAVDKSYPLFFKDYNKLGGIANVL
ncbi:MAG: 3-phosphoshikimate 1-carboxyvinyltransferase [Bacillota bacterium]